MELLHVSLFFYGVYLAVTESFLTGFLVGVGGQVVLYLVAIGLVLGINLILGFFGKGALK